MKKKINAPLLTGSIILMLLLSMIVAPGIFTKYNPYATETLKSYSEDNGNFRFMTPPFEPDERHVLGTDEMGRDMISLIVYGARLTIGLSVVVVLFRFILSLFVGIAAGFGNPLAQGAIRLSNIIFNFVPPLIICIMILSIRFFESLPKEISFWMFVFMLTIVGWARVAEVVQARSEEILKQDFIRGEISIGKSRGMIAITNVVPHIAAEMTVMAFMEIAIVLGLLMQLGAFKIFLGNLRIIEDTEGGNIVSKPMSFEPEWAAMIGASKTYLRSAPWLVFSPAIAFFISILGFNMFGEGLRKELQAQNSKFMVSVKRRFRSVAIAAGVIFVVMALTHSAGASTVLAMSEEMPGKEIVRQGDEEMAQWLEDKVISHGLKPLDDAYQHKYDYDPYWIPELAIFKDSNGVQFGRGNDFIVAGYGNGTYSGELYDGRMLDIIGFENPGVANGEFLLLDGTYYRESIIQEYILRTDKQNNVGAYIVVMSDLNKHSNMDTFRANKPVLYVSSDSLLAVGERYDLELTCVESGSKGINVFGMLEGKPDKVNDEAIIIGVEYNYESVEEQAGLKAALQLLEAFSLKEDQLERRVIFAFWDGKASSSGYGLKAYEKHPLYSPKDTALYLDISVLGESGQVLMDYSHAPHTRFYGWGLTQRAEKIGDAVGMQATKELTKVRPDIYSRGPSCIHMQLRPSQDCDAKVVGLNEFSGFIYDLILGGAY